jgi:hypothetical protein
LASQVAIIVEMSPECLTIYISVFQWYHWAETRWGILKAGNATSLGRAFWALNSSCLFSFRSIRRSSEILFSFFVTRAWANPL